MKSLPALTRPVAFAIVLALWAAIYLPGLGAVEIKGEEIRRIMPGVNMLQTGKWIVPEFNGIPYLRKPPLVNWAIALSIKTLGVRNEFSARLPSVLAILAMSLVILGVSIPWLGINTALAAVLIILTSAGIVEKGRLAEIEAIYLALSGMAIACWLAWTATARSPWMTWPLTGLILGLGLLAKGPAHLAFFYSIAGSIAFMSWRKRRPEPVIKTRLISRAHLAGLALMLAVFALWCVPYLRDTAKMGAAGIWARQLEQRMGGGDTGTIWVNFLRSLLNFLPWTLALPLFWRPATLSRLSEPDRLIIQAARWPIVACAFLLMFIPGMLPRYTLPLVIPYALLLALLLKAEFQQNSLRWTLVAASLTGVGMLLYGLLFAPRIASRGPSRDFASRINSVMPPGSPIYIFDPAVQPEVFYIHGQLLFTDTVKNLPRDVPWLLAPDSALDVLRHRFRETSILAHASEVSGKAFTFVSLRGNGQGIGETRAKRQ